MASGTRDVRPIYAVLALFGTARAFSAPAIQSILPNLVPRALLGKAFAWNSSSFQAMTIAGPAMGGDALFGPAEGSVDGDFLLGGRCRAGGALIEHHNNVGPQRILHGHAARGIEMNHRSIDVALEAYTLVGDAIEIGQGKDLKSAAVGEDRSRPSHEAMQIA